MGYIQCIYIYIWEIIRDYIGYVYIYINHLEGHDAILYFVTLHFISLHYITLHYVILYYITICCIMSYYIILYHILYHVISYYIILYYIILYYIICPWIGILTALVQRNNTGWTSSYLMGHNSSRWWWAPHHRPIGGPLLDFHCGWYQSPTKPRITYLHW
jgi:hypothetical protein